MVAMASDSYLLKVPQPPCQRCKKPVSSTSCCVVASLVLLLAAVVALAGFGYTMRMELCAARSQIQSLDTKIQGVQKWFEYLGMKHFEIENHDDPSPEFYSEEDDDEDEDDNDPDYTDLEEGAPFENRAREDSPSNVPRLEPAGSLQRSRTPESTPPAGEPITDDPSTATDATPSISLFEDMGDDSLEQDRRRRRREVGGRRPDPQLKLYHMLQNPGVVPRPAQVEPWGYHDSYRPMNRPQPMYAEHAPMAFVAPPQPSTPMSPVLNRRSRVMDDTFGVSTPSPRRRHHHNRSRTGRRQRLHQDVAQDVSTGRSVEVGAQYRRLPAYEQQGRQGPWRGPWRGARVTDTFHH